MEHFFRILISLFGIVVFVSVFDKIVFPLQITDYKEFITNRFALQTDLNSLSLMTYNIRFDFLDLNKQSWLYRKEKLLNNILLKSPDILSLQEDTSQQVGYLYKELNRIYDVIWSKEIFLNHNYTNLQHNSIFYKRNLFTPLFNQTIWLNENQTQNILGWDSKYPRTATIAIFKYKNNTYISNNIFAIVNVHLDHRGKIARKEGIRLVLKKVNEIISEQTNEKVPIFLMGDLNETPKQKVDQIILQNNYTDVWLKCKEEGNKCKFGEQYSSSFHCYTGSFVNNIFIRNLFYFVFYAHGGLFSEYGRYHIDHMYYVDGNYSKISPLYVSMPSDDLFMDKSGIYASDHFPIFAVFKIY